MSMKTKRTLAELLFIAVVCVGLAVHTGVGTPSMWGIDAIAALCPLGAIEAAIALRTMVPAGIIGLMIIVVVIGVFGRAFCAWGCPVPLLRRVLGTDGKYAGKGNTAAVKVVEANGIKETGQAVSLAKGKASLLSNYGDDKPDPARGGLSDSRNWMLGGAILTTAAFGFPVFCLICPVGLTFATVIVFWRMIQFGEATLSLLVFPAILVVELVVLRKWCHHLCPLAAVMSLIARKNRTFKATLDPSVCLQETKGIACSRCTQVCPEGIDMHGGAVSTPQYECIKCRECMSACPVHAISFPFLQKNEDKR